MNKPTFVSKLSIPSAMEANDNQGLLQVSKIESALGSRCHSQVNELYPQIFSAYEHLILDNHNQPDYLNAEYSFWKFHYKQIDEFRRRSSNSNIPVEDFSSFLDLAVNAYSNLIAKMKRNHGTLTAIETDDVQKVQYLWYRFLVCLGDLTRYKEQFCIKREKGKNWGNAAAYYVEASRVLPHNGHSQNQLAILATYEGDSFTALYRCIRSLACKHPFADAKTNLALLFEENRSMNFVPCYGISSFDFSKPGERLQQPGVDGKNLWNLIIRSLSFFFVPSSLEEFNAVFSATIMELDAVFLLDDIKMETELQSRCLIGSFRNGPFRVLEVFCMFMFALETLMAADNPGKARVALASVFVFFGRIVHRCCNSGEQTMCPLLPAVVVFAERLQFILEKSEPYACDENVARSITYFVDGFTSLVQNIDACHAEEPYGVSLWEDYELRGFSCFSPPDESLVFSNEHVYYNESDIRVHRLLRMAVPVSDLKKQWFSSNVKPANVDDDEVIVFKSLARNNSAPTPSKDGKILRRAMSLLITQNLHHRRGMHPPGPPPLTPFVGRRCRLVPVSEGAPEVALPSEDATWPGSDNTPLAGSVKPEYSGPLTSSEWLRQYRETCKWTCYDMTKWHT